MDNKLIFVSFSIFYNGFRCNTAKLIKFPFLEFELTRKNLTKIDKEMIINKAKELYPDTPIEKIEVSKNRR